MHPVRMQNMQSVDEGYYALLQGVQCMVLWVLVSEVVPQTPECISEQLHLLRLLSQKEHISYYRMVVLSLKNSQEVKLRWRFFKILIIVYDSNIHVLCLQRSTHGGLLLCAYECVSSCTIRSKRLNMIELRISIQSAQFQDRFQHGPPLSPSLPESLC